MRWHLRHRGPGQRQPDRAQTQQSNLQRFHGAPHLYSSDYQSAKLCNIQSIIVSGAIAIYASIDASGRKSPTWRSLVADAETKELLGASGGEVVHGILDMMYAKAPYTVLQRMVPIHPTVSELLPTVLADMKPA